MSRLLESKVVGLSISPSEEAIGLGFDSSEVNRIVLRMIAAFLSQGARVVLGHDWRDDGVMEAVFGFVQRYRSPEVSGGPALVTNVLPWPSRSRLSEDERRAVRGGIEIHEMGRPKEATGDAEVDRVLSLTALRHELTRLVDARVCVGGRRSAYEGTVPGVIEEAAVAFESEVPLYLMGFLRGAASEVIEALRQRSPDQHALHKIGPGISGTRHSPAAMLFGRIGVEDVARINRLTPAENERLFSATTVDEAIDLAIDGIARIPTRKDREGA
ncbi:hypothetical protein DSM104443_03199 [Usitatibacter rugosus]|uniref:Uncharacterized protein n=1 Tax=Usitatibacter rugosus TaxID=2732067 RepID=A0A6M4GYK5_9PROT|nr:hypothetical protein DSM104443_03199 [Usitatibacter rugosus]